MLIAFAVNGVPAVFGGNSENGFLFFGGILSPFFILLFDALK